MKKLPLITLLSFSILIPTITLAYNKDGYEYNLVEKKGINNYYFFDEPSTKSNFDERYEKNETTTTNYTLFKDFENEWIKTKSEEIMLSNNCNDYKQKYPSKECWSYAKFYYIFNEIEKNGRTIKASNYITKDDISQEESNIEKEDIYNKELRDSWENTTIIYHGHSGYKKNISGEWYSSTKNDNDEATAILTEKNIPPDINILSSDSGRYVSLICSAIKTQNVVQLVGYDDKSIENDKIGERPTIVKINRTYKTYKNNQYDGIEIDWNNLKTNMPNGSSTNYCDGKIYKTKQLTNDTNGVVHSAVLYKMQEISTEKQCVEIKNTSSAKCNESAKMENVKCLKTITKGKNRRDVKLDQTATLTNILTPTKIYQGGGIKLGFTYYNTVKWNFSEDEKYGDDSEIRTLLASKLKSTEEIENDITVEVYLKDENGKKYNIDNIQKKCTRDDDNREFEEDKTVTTTCTFLLPKSIVDLGTGKVTYKNSPGQGINNEYYTPITYTGELSLEATISNIGVLKDVDNWTNNWKLTYDGENDDSCKVNVTSRLYKPNQKNEYAFIYRPIDLNNPFPNRNAGVNWYDWYSIPANKDRLKSSYSKKEYQVELDNQSVSKIKEYNKNNNYLDWTGINKETGKSDFIDKYNIVRIQEGGNP